MNIFLAGVQFMVSHASWKTWKTKKQKFLGPGNVLEISWNLTKSGNPGKNIA